ncbi:MAG TPA: alpha-glucan family phosphorylase [Cyclobacteriaceae bacterium]|nr:alpha-glucan family phosphorylase [Cyclobacteriaceae bacterium]
MIKPSELFSYKIDKKYSKPAAYFSMEFAIDQPLKIYSGGLGFLAGSHMRSAYELKQNLIGIGILWKYGYYDQERNMDGTLKVSYIEKDYSFLTDTGIIFPITIHNHEVKVKAWLLRPEVFQTAPIFLLSTDIPENDHLAQTICSRLYDSHESARIAQSILLGTGGAKLLDVLERETEVYHMNEGHALPLCFYLLNKFNNDLEEVRKRVVFTTHTPEKAGNEEHSISYMEVMSFFNSVPRETVLKLAAPDEQNLSYTLAALRMARIANGVSSLHGAVSRKMWTGFDDICEITSITNAQNKTYWMDKQLAEFHKHGSDKGLEERKKEMKKELFKEVANQTGKIFDENVLTIVWARRYAAYKRANLLIRDFERFEKLVSNSKYPIQVIWAGKPYPEDHGAIGIFNDIYWKIKDLPNCAILTGYEMQLSGLLKRGSDMWLNTPKMYREASGTSGMTAAMNGSINLSIPDGWIPEFSKHGKNCFIITPAETENSEEQDTIENDTLLTMLEKEIAPLYYSNPKAWTAIVKQSMEDILPEFDSNRMAREYYEKMYSEESKPARKSSNSKEFEVI